MTICVCMCHYGTPTPLGGEGGGGMCDLSALSLLQQVLLPYDPKEKHLRVDKNITLRVYCKDKGPGTFSEHDTAAVLLVCSHGNIVITLELCH